MYKIGDSISFMPEALRYYKEGGYIQSKTVTGVVVYIHPQHRYLVLERRISPDRVYRETIFIKNGRQLNENDCNYEPEGWSGKNRHGANFNRRSKLRR